MKPSASKLLSLPQNDDVWFISFPKMRYWMEDEDEHGNKIVFRPHLILIVHLNSLFSLMFKPVKDIPNAEEIQNIIYELMEDPLQEMPTEIRNDFGMEFATHRPREIHVDDRMLPEQLGKLLEEVEIPVIYQPHKKIVKDLIIEILEEAGLEDYDILGLLKIRGATTQQIRMLFDAAYDFYKAEPWQSLSNTDLLSVQVLPHKNPMYVIVLGEGGEEYGLSVSRDLEEVKSLFSDNPQTTLPKKGRHAFLYSRPPNISFDDADAVEKFGWRLPEPDLYPMPSLFTENEYRRPDASMLRWYEAVLKAIPLFLENHLPEDYDFDQPPLEADFQINTSAGKTNVKIRFPGVDVEILEEIEAAAFDGSFFRLLEEDEEYEGYGAGEDN
jgi:hypothetical protein